LCGGEIEGKKPTRLLVDRGHKTHTMGAGEITKEKTGLKTKTDSAAAVVAATDLSGGRKNQKGCTSPGETKKNKTDNGSYVAP